MAYMPRYIYIVIILFFFSVNFAFGYVETIGSMDGYDNSGLAADSVYYSKWIPSQSGFVSTVGINIQDIGNNCGFPAMCGGSTPINLTLFDASGIRIAKSSDIQAAIGWNDATFLLYDEPYVTAGDTYYIGVNNIVVDFLDRLPSIYWSLVAPDNACISSNPPLTDSIGFGGACYQGTWNFRMTFIVPSPTPTPTATPAGTPTPTPTATATPTPTPTPTANPNLTVRDVIGSYRGSSTTIFDLSWFTLRIGRDNILVNGIATQYFDDNIGQHSTVLTLNSSQSFLVCVNEVCIFVPVVAPAPTPTPTPTSLPNPCDNYTGSQLPNDSLVYPLRPPNYQAPPNINCSQTGEIHNETENWSKLPETLQNNNTNGSTIENVTTGIGGIAQQIRAINTTEYKQTSGLFIAAGALNIIPDGIWVEMLMVAILAIALLFMDR